MVDIDFGKKLKELRIKEGFTQQTLANRLGISKSVVSYYELHERTPSPDIIKKLSSIFHVSSDYLLGIDKTETIDVTGLTPEERSVIENMVTLLRSQKKN